MKQGGIPPLIGYDRVILGSSVYIGAIRGEAKAFIAQNKDILLKKKLGLFLSCMEANQDEEFFKNNFPGELLQSAAAALSLGGIFDPKKAGFLERLVVKIASRRIGQPGNTGYFSNIDDARIEQFVRDVLSA